MALEPSERRTKLTEKYHLGKLRIPDYEAGGRMDIGVLVIYTKETNELGREPTRECARFRADCHNDYFSGDSIYSGYVKYTSRDGSIKRMFLAQAGRGEYAGEDREVDTSFKTENWGEDMLELIKPLPDHVRDLFNLS